MSGHDEEYSFTATSDRDLVANFILKEYALDITADPEEGGTVTGAKTYYHGEKVTITAEPSSGYVFVNWTENGEKIATDPEYTFTIETDLNFTANFEEQYIPVESITLNEAELELKTSQTFKLEATVLPANASNKNVLWKSSNENAVIVVKTGETEAVAVTVGEGNSTITATTEDGGYTAICEITVLRETITAEGITLDKTELTLFKGDIYILQATINPENATNQDIIWESSDSSIATVKSYGFLGMVTAVNNGVAVISATTSDGGHTAECQVTVTDESDVHLEIISTDSDNEETGVRINKLIRVFFNVPIQAGDDFEGIKLINTNTSEEIDIEKKVDAGRNLIINMASAHQRLEYNTTYKVVIPAKSVESKKNGSTLAEDYTFSFTTAESKKPVEGLTLNQNYFNIGNPNSAATIVPVIEPYEATDQGLTWIAGNNEGVQLAGDGTYLVTSRSGNDIGTLEELHRGNTTWGIFRPTSPGTTNITVLAEGGEVQQECVIDVFFGYGIVTGTELSVSDAIMILRNIVGLTELDRVQRRAANVTESEDGEISVSDAILVLRKIVGLVDEFPVEEK